MKRPLTFAVVFVWLTLRVVAAPATADLGQGLRYVRVNSVGETLPALLESGAADRTALVIDLRYATTSDDDVRAFAEWITQRGGAAAPLFLLVSPATPETLAEKLGALPRGVLTLGVAGSLPAPAVIVAQTAETDRRAYDAWPGGMPLDTLLTGKVEKERYDESSLVRDFQNGTANPAPPPAPDPTRAPPPEKAPVLTDRVLQRAVHLHRALEALKMPAR